MLILYGLKQCGTTRKALRYLEERGTPFRFYDIRNAPPSRDDLHRAVHGSLPVKRFFNTSGGAYREGGYKNLVPSMTPEQAVDVLIGDPMLIKRPLVIGEDIFLVGFKQEEYDAAL